MRDKRIFLVFLWHMHQPIYKDPLTGQYVLPWVRLHGCKDYLDMVTILDDFPGIRQNINIVPSLLRQIEEYTKGEADDIFLRLSMKPVAELSSEEKTFMLENFFLANWQNMIKPLPRYYELLKKRGLTYADSDIKEAVHYFSDADLTDLQVLFNLAWIDPHLRMKDPELSQLAAKGAQYTEEDKRLVIAKQIDILRKIIPVYREAHDRGKIELSVSPYFHPILPLLCNNESARMGMPDVKLPSNKFSYPEDADLQIKNALNYFEELFGFRPVGMWPSEGAVSEDVLHIVEANGIHWVASDEAVLSASLGKPLRDNKGALIDSDLLYTDYIFGNVSILFRDHILSDLIGFEYSSWDPEKAAEDFIKRIISIHGSSISPGSCVVPVILDGENAWEFYKNDGRDFLNSLYTLISDDKRIECITISDYIMQYSAKRKLEKLHAGSWINASFSIWIGHEEDNTAWDYIFRTRHDLVELEHEETSKIDEAWMHLYAAEGSDWFWWYGDDHITDNATEFDRLFRHNLMAVYKSLSQETPDFLHIPVLKGDRGIKPAIPMRGFINPTIDGLLTSYFEWLEGTYVDIAKAGGSMHKAQSLVSRIYYGFNKDCLFIRADGQNPFDHPVHFTIHFIKPFPMKISAKGESLSIYRNEEELSTADRSLRYAIADIFEIAVPFQVLEAKENDEISFFLMVSSDSESVERCPWRGHISLNVPPPDFDSMMWI